MSRTIKRKVNIYTVHWYRNDFCYRTTMGCDWKAVLDCKRTAKLLGEKIVYEKEGEKVYEYTI